MGKRGRPKGSKSSKNNAIAEVVRLQKKLRSLSARYGKKNLVKLIQGL